MTDAPGLPPEQEAVRRLLAEARHDDAAPPEVVARLDAALASLVAERGDAPLSEVDDSSVPLAPVVDLGARRRRIAGVGLLAAAAVVVAGVAIGQGLPRMAGEDAGSAAGGDVATSQERESGDAGDSSNSGESDSSAGSAEMGPQSLKSTAPEGDHPTLSSDDTDLDDDLLDLRATQTGRVAGPGASDALARCELGGVGPGRRVVAEVDGQPGVVVYRPPAGAAQDVALYVCGTPEPVRTLTLPAP